MSTMVEKVAMAICALHYQDPSELTNAYPDGPMYPVWQDFEKSARAALEAMMEPTGAMEDVVERYCNFPRGHHHGAPLVKQIIRAALKEQA